MIPFETIIIVTCILLGWGLVVGTKSLRTKWLFVLITSIIVLMIMIFNGYDEQNHRIGH